jgi:hypothetical protein
MQFLQLVLQMQSLLNLGYISTSVINFHDFESFVKIDEMDNSFAFIGMQSFNPSSISIIVFLIF